MPGQPILADRLPLKAIVNAAIGAACVLLGIAAVYVAMPNRRGESPRFIRHDVIALVYPALCLLLFAMGLAMIFAG